MFFCPIISYHWYPLRLLGVLGLHPIGTDDKGPPWDCALDVFDKSGIACGAMLSNPGPRVADFSTRKVFGLIL